MCKERPNILFIFSDQHRWCDMAYSGNEEISTPNWDAFSKQAVNMAQCVSNSPLCVPARGTLLTGLYPIKHGALANDLPIRSETPSIATALKVAGYHTGYIGKWHLGGIPRERFIPKGERLGFEEWKVANCNHDYNEAFYFDEDNQRTEMPGYEPTGEADLAIEFIERNTDAKPWSLYLAWGPPHDPYHTAPIDFKEIYKDKALTLRENVPDEIAHTIDKTRTAEDIRKNYKGYYAHISALDHQFGRILKALEESGQRENTIVVYTSDHGDMLGSQGFTNKQLPFEESIRIPFLIDWPGHSVAGQCEAMFSIVDFVPTLLGLVEVDSGYPMDGYDWSRAILGENVSGPDSCYIFDLVPCHQSAWRGGEAWRGIRTASYTYTCSVEDGGLTLFDHKNDPYQKENLINHNGLRDLRDELYGKVVKMSQSYDGFLPWPELLANYELLPLWNRSQKYFNEPTIEGNVEL